MGCDWLETLVWSGMEIEMIACVLSQGITIEDTAVTPTGSVTPSASTGGHSTGIKNTGVVSDPAIDEHFKRSLGLKNYAAVFNATSSTDKETGLSGEWPALKHSYRINGRYFCTSLLSDNALLTIVSRTN